MTGKHTPGPWVVMTDYFGENEIEIVSNAGTHSVPVADIMFDKHTTFAPPLAEAMANAHLIAAAPDLLEALMQLVSQIEFMASIAGTSLEENNGYQAARAAIAKARGQE